MDYFVGMSRDAFQAHLYSTTRERIEETTVGAAILRTNTAGNPEILLLKRGPSEEHCLYTMPGGKVRDTNASIYTELARLVAKETQFTVKSILSTLPSFRYTSTKSGSRRLLLEFSSDGRDKTNSVKRRVIQSNYIIDTEEDDMDLLSKESREATGGWFDATAVEELPMPTEMRDVVSWALGQPIQHRKVRRSFAC